MKTINFLIPILASFLIAFLTSRLCFKLYFTLRDDSQDQHKLTIGNYIFTNTFEKIDVISGEPTYLPQVLSSFRMAFKLLPPQEFATFSLSSDDKYLIVSNRTINNIEEFLKGYEL